MTTSRSTDGEVLTETLEEQFLELVCADPDLLQAEFEAIVSAEWPAPSPQAPPRLPPLRRPAGRPPVPRGGDWRGAGLERLASRPRDPGIGGWGRQRSPPERA